MSIVLVVEYNSYVYYFQALKGSSFRDGDGCSGHGGVNFARIYLFFTADLLSSPELGPSSCIKHATL